MIEIKNVSVVYPTKNGTFTALEPISFSVARGERVAIMGRSGTGKSTLLSVLGAITKGSSGSYQFGGQNIFELNNDVKARFRGEKIGFVFQDSNLLPHMSVMENVMLPVDHMRGVEIFNIRKQAEALLEVMGIVELRNRFPSQISGGQAQRVAIARALVRDPEVIIADEPTGSLDDETTSEILTLLDFLSKKEKTIILATHDENVAMKSDRTMMLSPRL